LRCSLQTTVIAQNARRARQNLAHRIRVASGDPGHFGTRLAPAFGRGSGDALGDEAATDGRLKEGIAGKPIGAVEARGRGLAASPETLDRCTPGKIDRDAAHVIMRRRADWNRLSDRIDSGRLTIAGDRRKATRKIEIRHDSRIEKNAVSRRHVPPNGASDNVARCKLGAGHAGHKATASLVD
jgi:hypothetical protein